MKLFKKIAAIVICVAMLASVASCGGDTTWAMKYGEYTVNSGLYLYYLTGAYSSAASQVEDSKKDVLKQTVDGKDAAEWIREKANESAKLYLAIQKLAEEKGIELSAENANLAEQYANFYWAYYGKIYSDNGIGLESIQKALKGEILISQVFGVLYGKDGEKEIPADDIKSHLAENYAKTKEIVISLASVKGEMRSEELQTTLKQLAETYKTRLEAGEDIDLLIKEQDAYEKKLAAEESSDTSDEETSSEETSSEETSSEDETDEAEPFVIVEKDASAYTDNEKDTIFALKTGDVAVVTEKEYIRVVKRYDVLEDEEYLKQYDSAIRSALKGEEFSDDMEKLADELDIEINEAAIKRYKPSKIKL